MKARTRIEAFDGKYYWSFHANRIYKQTNIEFNANIKPYNIIDNNYVKYYFPLLNRLLRTGIHNIIPMKKGYLVIVKNNFLIYNENKLVKAFSIPRGSRPLRNSICIKDDYVFFGDYWGNKEHKEAYVYKLNMNTFELEIILSLQVRHIHFIVFGQKPNELIIGTGDEDNESLMMFFNYKTKEKTFIGQGSQMYRAVSIIQYNKFLIWGTDAPDEKNYIYAYDCETKDVTQLVEIVGPAYYSTMTKKGEMFIATTVENRNKHKAILYKSTNLTDWIKIKEFKKDILPEKLFGYGVIEFMHGQNKVEKLHYNLVNLYETK